MPSLFRLLTISTALIVFAALPSQGKESFTASDGAFRLDLESGLEGVRFVLSNLEPFPITVRLGVGELHNLESNVTLPRVRVVSAKDKVELARLRVVESGKSWQYGKVKCTYQVGSIRERPLPFAYELPFDPGVSVRVDQGFDGAFSHGGRNAIDFGLDRGDRVRAARGGKVVKVVSDQRQGGPDKRLRGKANRVWVLHTDGTFGCYAHFAPDTIVVSVGDRVSTGDVLGKAGATGFALGPHLHFEVRYAKKGNSRAATYPIRFRTRAGSQEALRVGKSYRRPKPLACRLRVASEREGAAGLRVGRSGKLWVRVEPRDGFEARSAKLRVHSLEGRQVHQVEIALPKGPSAHALVTKLPKGIYTLRLASGELELGFGGFEVR